MKQTRINHKTVLHIHNDITYTLDLNSMANEFVQQLREQAP